MLITHRVPFPQKGGYQIVVGNTAKGLVRLGHQVTLMSLNGKKSYGKTKVDKELLDKINYKVHDIDISISIWDMLVNLFSKTSFNIDRYYDPAFEGLLLKEIKSNDYDVIQFEGLLVSLYLPAIQRATNAKLIYRAHNIENQVWTRLAQQKTDPFKKYYLQMHARRIKSYELQQLNKFDAITVFTQQDKAVMESYGVKIPVEVLPVGIDLENYQPDVTAIEFPSLFFLGSLEWLPNREGMEWFLDNFLTALTEGDLNVKLYVAGSDIPESFDDYEVMGKIFIQGEVDDSLQFINSKSIMIVPLFSGGGMRVKIVEGMAMEKCIISTSLGVEGINFTDGENILIANTRDEFYQAIKRCIKDEKYCRTIGENARKLVQQQHNNNTVANSLVSFYQSL
ncbi:MAG: glycosyltransferase [Sphingobacteriaceae bacterium]|nr:MAG: glycosyltransferase [Sphingobacteriaceae bacterium]